MTLFNIIRSYGGGVSQDVCLENEVKHLEALNSGLPIGETQGSRNEGLIAFTEEGMKYHDMWAEETATIYLDREEPTFEVSGTFYAIFEEDYEDFEKRILGAVKYNIFDEFTVDESDYLMELVNRTSVFLCDNEYWLPVG